MAALITVEDIPKPRLAQDKRDKGVVHGMVTEYLHTENQKEVRYTKNEAVENNAFK